MLGGGAETIGTLQQQAQASAGESGLVDLATATEAIASNTAQQRRVSVAPRSRGTAQLVSNSTLELTVIPADGSPQTVYETDMGSIRYTDSDATGRFEGGGVWMTTDGVANQIIAPPIDYQQSSSGTATLSVAPTTIDGATENLGSRFLIRQSTSTAATYSPESSTNPLTEETLQLTITTTMPSMWAQYLRDTTPATVSTNRSTVTAVFTPPDTAPPPDSAIQTTGSDQTVIDTQDRVVTGNSPDRQVSTQPQYQADFRSRGPVAVTESAIDVTVLGTVSAPRISTVGNESVNAIEKIEQEVASPNPSITGQLTAVTKEFSSHDLRETGQRQSGGQISSGTTELNSKDVVTDSITVTNDATLVISDNPDGSRSRIRVDGTVYATDDATIIIDTQNSNTTFAPAELHVSDNANVVIRGDNHADIITDDLTFTDESTYRFSTGTTATTGVYVHNTLSLHDSAEIGAGGILPNQVWLYVADSVETRSATQVTVTGVIYAPDADLTVNGDTRVDGAIIAKSLELKQNTLEVQYDATLETKSPFTARDSPHGTLRVYATETPITIG